MLVTEFGIVTDAKLVQPSKTLSLMYGTEFGIVTDAKLVHPSFSDVSNFQNDVDVKVEK